MNSPGRAARLKIGISSCLLGQKVRYDGGHKRDRFLTDILGEYVDWVPVCPEVEIGLGTPRPTIRLQSDSRGRVRLVMPSTGEDLTKTMHDYSVERVGELDKHDLSGYVLKKDSPSCGLERVKVYDSNDVPARNGTGTYAEVIVSHRPHLPVEEEGRLNDGRLRENFIARIFAYRRLRAMILDGPTRRSLMEFHAAHKYQLMSHNQAGMRRLGKLLGSSSPAASPARLASEYMDGFTEVMRRGPTRRNHTNALHHAAGHVSESLDSSDRGELAATISEYREGLVPLIVPVVLLRHYVRKLDVPYLRDQTYLWPHPHELMLLNHV